MVYLKGFLCDSASKSIGFCNIYTNFTMFSTIFVRINCSVDRTQFNPYYIITDFAGAFRRNHRFRCKSFFNLLIHLKQIKVFVNCRLKNLKSRVGGESTIRPLCQILVNKRVTFFWELTSWSSTTVHKMNSFTDILREFCLDFKWRCHSNSFLTMIVVTILHSATIECVLSMFFDWSDWRLLSKVVVWKSRWNF